MKILMDMDGVLADFWWGFSGIMNALDSNVKRITTLERMTWGYTEDEKDVVGQAWDVVRESSKYWRNLESLCMDGTFHRIDKLRKRHEVYFVTNRVGLRPKQDTEAWLIKRGVGNPTVIIPKMTMTDMVPHSNKAEIGSIVGIDYSLEDNINYARALEGVCQSFLVTRLYNLAFEFENRVNSVDDFLDHLEKEEPWRT